MRFIIFTFLLTSVTVVASAQCNSFYNFSEGATWEMNIHDKKGKLDGRALSEVKELDKTSGGWDALVSSTYYDKKDKEVHSGEFEMACIDGRLRIDMERMIPQETIESFRNMDMTVEGDFVEIPENISVGQELDNSTITISGNIPFEMKFRMYDRKVTGKETITVPAGTFECYKIEYKMEMKTVMTMQTAGIEYIAENVGVVKQETYNKNGKLTGYTELNSYSF